MSHDEKRPDSGPVCCACGRILCTDATERLTVYRSVDGTESEPACKRCVALSRVEGIRRIEKGEEVFFVGPLLARN